MTIRALVLGVLLGLAIACFAYFNDQIIRQTYLIGHHLPPAVFGGALLLLLIANPLLRALGRRWVLGPAELAFIIALALAVCGHPGASLMRTFSHLMAVPGQQRPHRAYWDAAGVFAYVPGGPPDVAEGYVADWPALVRGLSRGDAPILAAVRQALSPGLRRALDQAAQRGEPPATGDRRQLLHAINAVLMSPRRPPPPLALDAPEASAGADAIETVARRRAALEAALPGVFKPAPRGRGLLLDEGEPIDAATDPLFAPPQRPGAWPRLQSVDWSRWWPVLRLWVGAAALLGLATLCLIVIVHRQWTRHELLPYPTARFVQEVAAASPGRAWPNIAGSSLFWLGLGAVALIHLINGLHAYLPALPHLPLNLNFNPLRELMPRASQASGSQGLFHPRLYFAVIGFAFFIQTRTALSVGLALPLWVGFSALMLGLGVGVSNHRFDPEAWGPSLRFGAYLGLTLMVLYLGRRYYLAVARAAAGLGPGAGAGEAGATRGAAWALRGMLLCVGLAGWLLARDGGLGWALALALIGSVLMIALVLARINAETGLFYAQPDLVPAVVFAGLLGWEGLGPEASAALLIGSLVLVGGARLSAGPFFANGLALMDRLAGRSAGRAALPMGAMLIAGLLVAVVTTLALQHHYGLPDDRWAWYVARRGIDQLARAINDLSAQGQIEALTALPLSEQLSHARPRPAAVGAVLAGMTLVFLCAAARLRLAWWPLHPVVFLIVGTWPASMFGFSFLLAAAVKHAIVRVGGRRAHDHAKPLMVGLIAGEILMVVFWSLIGLGFFLRTGQPPARYVIFPW